MITCENASTVCGWPISMDGRICDACYQSGFENIELLINRALEVKIKVGDRPEIAHKKDVAELAFKLVSRTGIEKCEKALVEAVSTGALTLERAIDIATAVGLDLQRETQEPLDLEETPISQPISTTTDIPAKEIVEEPSTEDKEIFILEEDTEEPIT